MARRLVRAAHADALHFANDARMLHCRRPATRQGREVRYAVPHTFPVTRSIMARHLSTLTSLLQLKMSYSLPGQHGCVPCLLQ